MNPQLEGIEAITGTYAFDLRVSNRTLKLNRFFWHMIRAENRETFLNDPVATMTAAGLTADEQAMVQAQDWLGLVRHGVNFFVLEKFARVVRKTNLEVYALMRGETLDEFMATRRVPTMR
ncbi:MULTISPECIES: protocatechuate 3,4-dioxygenase [Pandoraea]|uniref:Protocatechuate 3,4-dioxygenase n=1 Tax=Pandoraea capi TaxID=2508286 RepID=A0ABY6VV06_9BURK|nr:MULTISPECIES: protocatechuate 3,4-dioxygenase [Pandoraea]MCI3207364.1 protocatechuate 3,4-dioxygenase [Pandoraea sp. LA3]MDN4585393.1 protocatechuate 3,4-dioxygenase [Pandoraea capi]ODP32812.1 protocatechuate 3,4-dioxygenase [Pandoraea sp. ISTKB]VVD92023.1 protocatechuate 3,4-dioxygenase [Pandoraea capi]